MPSWTTANQLTVGPMGFGGKTSLIGCKIGALNRLPASFFVSIAYDCWAFRRLGVTLDARSGAITSWLYREGDTPSVPMLTAEAAGRRLPADGPRGPSAGADHRRADPRAARSATSSSSPAGCSPAATPSTRT